MRGLTRTARFRPGDSTEQILEDLACPACGHRDPAARFPSITGEKVRFFCDACGTFVTIVLSAEQAAAMRRRSSAELRAGESRGLRSAGRPAAEG